MDAENIVKLVGDYGVMIIICGIFLYAAIRLITVFIDWLKSKTSKTTHDELINARVDVGNQIHELITCALVELKAERIQVIEFANSVVSVAYLPFRYMTCTYEVYDIDREPVGHKIDRISTSLFSPFFAKLQERNMYIFTPTDDQELSEKSLCTLTDVDRWTACIPLRTGKEKMIGYVQTTRSYKFSDDDQLKLQLLGARISELLTVFDK